MDPNPYATPPSAEAPSTRDPHTGRRLSGVILGCFGLGECLAGWLMHRHGFAMAELVLAVGVFDVALGVALVPGVRFARGAGIARALSMLLIGLLMLSTGARAIYAPVNLLLGAGLCLLLWGTPSRARIASALALMLGGILFARLVHVPPRPARTYRCGDDYVATSTLTGHALGYHAPIPPTWCLARETSLEPTRTLAADATLVNPWAGSTLYVAGRRVTPDAPFEREAFSRAVLDWARRRWPEVTPLSPRPVAGRPERQLFGYTARSARHSETYLCVAIASDTEVVVPCAQVPDAPSDVLTSREVLASTERLFASLELDALPSDGGEATDAAAADR